MKKYSIKFLYYTIVKALLGSVVLFFFSLFALNTDESKELFISWKLAYIPALIILGMLIITIIYSILYYNRTTYELTNKEIILKKGVFFKKTTILAYSKIHAVDKKEGLIQKLFGIASLSLDSGSTTRAHIAEIIIYEEKDLINQISDTIDERRFNPEKANEEVSPDVIDTPKEKGEEPFTYSYNAKGKALCSLFYALFFIISCVVYSIVASIVLAFIKEKSMEIYFVSLTLIGIAVFTWLISFLISLFAFYNYKIYKNDKEISIRYGLFVNVNNKIAYNRIHGVIVTQGIFQRIFGFASIKLSVVGYGSLQGNNNENQNTTTSFLIPFCRKKDVNKYLSELLPDYTYEEKEIKSTSFKYHFLAPFIISSIIIFLVIALSTATLLVDYRLCFGIMIYAGGLYLLYILLALIISIFLYKNSGMTIREDKIVLFNGVFIYRTYIIKKKYLTSIEKKDTYLRRKNHLTTYIVHYFTNSLTNVVYVPIIDDRYYEEINSLIKK